MSFLQWIKNLISPFPNSEVGSGEGSKEVIKHPKHSSTCKFCGRAFKNWLDVWNCKYCKFYFCTVHHVAERHNCKGRPVTPVSMRRFREINYDDGSIEVYGK